MNAIQKKIINKFYSLFNIGRLGRLIKKNNLYVLMYHSITNKEEDYPYSISVSNFINHIKYIHKRFKVIDLNETLFYLQNNKDIKEPCFAITFDDGYRNNFTHAYPILKKFDMPFSIFVATNFINTKRETFMNWDEVIELSNDPLVTIGSHSVNHPNLLSLEKEDIKYEIEASKKIIESKINKEVKYFAYPSGGHNDEVIKVAKKFYEGAFKDNNYNGNPINHHAISRIDISKRNEDLKSFIITLINS